MDATARASLAVILAVTASGCAPLDPTAGYELSALPVAQAEAARAALRRADTVLTIVGDPNGEYVGEAYLSVACGPNASVVFRVSGTSSRSSRLWVGANFLVPDDQAVMLASSGWNFTAVYGDPSQPVVLQGDHTNARIENIEMRADPDGLLFATLHVTDLAAGPLVVTVTGRITGIAGGCAVTTGGSPMLPADVARCNAVVAHLSPGTGRNPLPSL